MSCSANSEEVIERWTNGNPKVVKFFYHRDSFHYQLITYYENGKTQELTHFEEDTRNGWNIIYYESGKVKDSIFLQDNLPIAESRHFYENGNPKSEGSYLEGKRDGAWYFYDSGSFLHEIRHYDFGLQNGITSTFNQEGWLIKEIDKFREGGIKEIINYKDSLRHGHYELFDSNGNHVFSGAFNRGKKTGTRWTIFRPSGSKFKEIVYTSENEWDTQLVNLWDLNGEQTVVDGNGFYQYDNYMDCDGKKIVENQVTLYYAEGQQIKRKEIALQDCNQ